MVSFLRWRYRFEAAIGLGAENVPSLRFQPPKVKMGQHESTRSLCEACIGVIFWPQVTLESLQRIGGCQESGSTGAECRNFGIS